jgi:uncharacterized protein (TIGR02246 family)
MKLSFFKTAILLAAMSIASQAGADSLPKKVPMKPEEVDILIFEHFRNNDLDAVMSLYEPDATLVIDDKTFARGHEAMRKVLSGFLNAEKLEWVKGPVAWVNSTNDLAITRGTWRATFKDKDGKLTTIMGKNVEIVRKQPDGSWRFVVDHANGAD